MKYRLRLAAMIVLASTATLCLAGPTDANEANFLAAIKKRSAGEKACLQSHIWVRLVEANNPVYFFQDDGTRRKPALDAEFAALKTAGVVSDGVGYLAFPKNMVWTRDLKLTELGRSASTTEPIKYLNKPVQLCFATPQPVKVVKWEGPAPLAGSTVAKVTFIYKLDHIADWANNEKVQAFYPELQERVKQRDGASGEIILKLTNLGWE